MNNEIISARAKQILFFIIIFLINACSTVNKTIEGTVVAALETGLAPLDILAGKMPYKNTRAIINGGESASESQQSYQPYQSNPQRYYSSTTSQQQNSSLQNEYAINNNKTTQVEISQLTSEQRTYMAGIMDQIITEASKKWLVNRYDKGSMNNVSILSRSHDIVVVKGYYTYNNGQRGWVEMDWTQKGISCLRYHDNPTCINSALLLGTAAILGMTALIVAADDNSSLTSSTYSENNNKIKTGSRCDTGLLDKVCNVPKAPMGSTCYCYTNPLITEGGIGRVPPNLLDDYKNGTVVKGFYD